MTFTHPLPLLLKTPDSDRLDIGLSTVSVSSTSDLSKKLSRFEHCRMLRQISKRCYEIGTRKEVLEEAYPGICGKVRYTGWRKRSDSLWVQTELICLLQKPSKWRITGFGQSRRNGGKFESEALILRHPCLLLTGNFCW